MNPIALDSPAQTAAYLRTLPAIRERCGRVHALAQKGELEYFEYHPEKENDAAAFCVNIIKVRADMYSLGRLVVDQGMHVQRDFGTNFTSVRRPAPRSLARRLSPSPSASL